jgi:hypothetical protein
MYPSNATQGRRLTGCGVRDRLSVLSDDKGQALADASPGDEVSATVLPPARTGRARMQSLIGRRSLTDAGYVVIHRAGTHGLRPVSALRVLHCGY